MSIINSVEQLRALSQWRELLRYLGGIPATQFAIPEFPEAINREATEKLLKYRTACGCLAGGLAMSFSVIAFFAVVGSPGTELEFAL